MMPEGITVERLPAIKPGYKTTEWWTALIYTLLSFANQSGFFGHQLPIDSVMTIAAPVVTYIVTRSAVKAFAAFTRPVDPKTLND